MTYDATGNLLCRKTFGPNNVLLETRDFLGNFEYINNVLDYIHTSQGRYKSISAGVYRHEYTIEDHLGNTRVVYSDLNNDGLVATSEILDENHYYAYGMELPGSWINVAGTNYNYKFNGIERVESLQLDFALYRGLDPVLGRWMQVDPKAEQSGYGMSPYCSMNNNPISQADPNGDFAFVPLLIGAAIGAISGGISNGWEGAWKGAIVGAIGGAVPQISLIATLGNVGSGAITGAVTGGLNAAFNSQNILKGAVFGAAIGTGIGLVQDGIQNYKEVITARKELIANGYDPNGAIPMTDVDLKQFVLAHGDLNSMYNKSGLPDLNAGSPPSFSGYKLSSDGLFTNSSGNSVAGVTRQLNGNISIHVAPSRFTKALKLYTTVGHELNHAVDFFNGSFASWSALGGQNFARNISEFKAHTWSLNVGRQISFETARHQAALNIYSSQMSNRDWVNFLKLYGF
jgi:RHS repeat-associated protein